MGPVTKLFQTATARNAQARKVNTSPGVILALLGINITLKMTINTGITGKNQIRLINIEKPSEL